MNHFGHCCALLCIGGRLLKLNRLSRFITQPYGTSDDAEAPEMRTSPLYNSCCSGEGEDSGWEGSVDNEGDE